MGPWSRTASRTPSRTVTVRSVRAAVPVVMTEIVVDQVVAP
jgi:hypothetical protein